MDIKGLVQNAKKGDKESLSQLIMAQQSDYYKIAYVYTENRQDALDAVADMTVILYQHINKLKDDELFYNWSKTILINCCRAIQRARVKVVYFEECPESPREERYNIKEMRSDIIDCVRKLNNYQQEVIKLKYFMDMDYDSISKISNVPLGTAKSRTAKALVKLKKCFGGEY
jgi:RNA polymerase sigma factor (sigma-70 family)